MSENQIPRAVQEYVEKHTRTFPTGETYAVDERGIANFHSDRDGAPFWSPADLAEWTKRYKPDLWREAVEAAAKAEPAPAAASKVSGPDPWRHATKTLTAAPGSVSDLMVRAKAGDAVALAAIKAELGIK